MLNDNVKNLILGTINLYENSNLNQAIIDEGFQNLKQAKKLLTEDNSEPPSNLKDEYDKQYNIHKDDNVAAIELPYVNREFYEHTFLPNEDVLIGFYVDDNEESYYKSEIKSVYKLVMYDNHEVIKVDYIYPGSQQMNFGKLAEGEHILSYEVQDIYGRKSFRDYFEIRVKTPIVKSEYIIADSEIPSNSDSIGWLNQLILDLDESYNYLTLPTGTYKMKYGETLILKDNLTLNLNGSEIVLEDGQVGDRNLQIDIKQCYDAHVINGTIVGDRVTHDYENSPNNSEWVNGIGIEGRSKYSSYENIEVRDITGYGSIEGFAGDRSGEGYCWSITGFQKNWNEDTKCTESDFIDLTKFKVEGCEFIQVGLYLGYQGRPDSTWYFEIEMYNENKELVDKFNGYYYRKIFIPKEVKYCKIYSIVGAEGMYTNTQIFAFKTPVNCEFKNVRHVDCRCVGCAPTSMESLRMIDCYFTRCGSNAAKCAFDSEDGWDMMHDFYMAKCNFHDNPNNDWLTCAGHNFLIENNEYNGGIHIWTRAEGMVVRNNKIKYIKEGNNKESKHYKIYNNEATETITSTKCTIKNCKAVAINNNSKNCEIYGLGNSANHKGVNNKYIFKDGWSGYISNLKIKDSEVSYIGKETCDISFNSLNSDVLFDNVKFIGKYNFRNHNNFNSGTFKNCEIEHIYIDARCQDKPNNSEVVFENCKMTFSSLLMKGAPYAYSEGECHFRFKNCEIIDDGEEYSWAYGKVTDMIYFFSKPVNNSYIIFENCTITKQGGALVGSRTKEEKIKCNIEFNNCTLNGDFKIFGEAAIPEKTNIKVFINGVEQA